MNAEKPSDSRIAKHAVLGDLPVQKQGHSGGRQLNTSHNYQTIGTMDWNREEFLIVFGDQETAPLAGNFRSLFLQIDRAHIYPFPHQDHILVRLFEGRN